MVACHIWGGEEPPQIWLVPEQLNIEADHLSMAIDCQEEKPMFGMVCNLVVTIQTVSLHRYRRKQEINTTKLVKSKLFFQKNFAIYEEF